MPSPLPPTPPEPVPDSTDGRTYRSFMVYLRPLTHLQLATLVSDARAAHGSSSARAILTPLIHAAYLARPFTLSPATPTPDDASPPGELRPTSIRFSPATRAELAALNEDVRDARGAGTRGSYTQVITELVRRAHQAREDAKARANRKKK